MSTVRTRIRYVWVPRPAPAATTVRSRTATPPRSTACWCASADPTGRDRCSAASTAPGCANCHLHDRDHGDTMDAARGAEVREWVCGGCHAPRYVREQLDAGARLQEVADLKAEEAEHIAAQHPMGGNVSADLLVSARKHARNVRLGAGHQSPDYQWWHGQPALDGDLIRLRDAVARALGEAAGAAQVEADSPSARRESAPSLSSAGR